MTSLIDEYRVINIPSISKIFIHGFFWGKKKPHGSKQLGNPRKVWIILWNRNTRVNIESIDGPGWGQSSNYNTQYPISHIEYGFIAREC
jgi:hypothetical protein